MTYIEQIATGELSKYIDKFWYCQSDSFTNRTLTIPLLHHELVFNFSDYYRISRNAGLETILENSKSWISGIQTSPVVSECVGKHEMIGVLFKPNGLKAFIKYNSSDFENNFIEADLIFDKSFEILLGQLETIQNPLKKIFNIQNYLIKNLNIDSSPLYLNASLNLFKLSTNNRISVKETCIQISVSNKSLIQSYQKHIGTTPIKYLQLQSINKALIHLTNDPLQSFTKLAYDLNYFDQSHFINSFKTITGITPTKFAEYVLNRKVDNGSPNFISY